MELLFFEETWKNVWDGREPQEPVGAVFTKPAVVETILDLVGYDPARFRLAELRLLEPSCGDGAFLAEVIKRVLASELHWKKSIDWSDPRLELAISACDLNSGFVAIARKTAFELLCAEGCGKARAEELAASWIQHADFLLTGNAGAFDFVVGNPPYVRIEDLPPVVLQRYRELYPTCTDRADIYIAFFEKGLRLLTEHGCLGYICANRFAKNAYGRELRKLITRDFHVRYYLNLEDTQPFETQVSAYPCITIIDRQRGEPTAAATLADLECKTLTSLRENTFGKPHPHFAFFPSWYQDGGPWIATERRRYDRMVALSERCPLLEESAEKTVVGIGVATGADEVYVVKGAQTTVEESCQLPLLMAADIQPDKIEWSGHHLINPFSDADDGTLRELKHFPKLAAYFEEKRRLLEARHIAQKRPANWYRTIDRVTLALVQRPKLVIPDIQFGGVVGYDEGKFYPHHNVYWITSTGWDLRALQTLLRSTIVLDQVRAHSVQMRGGAIRYQAQVLRKLRVPSQSRLSCDLITRLVEASTSLDQVLIDTLAEEAFGLAS